MILFKKYYYLIPVLLIIIQLIIIKNNNFVNPISPQSLQNNFNSQLINALNLADLKPKNIVFRDFQSEVEFYLSGKNATDFPVILSTKINPLTQVAVLQKLLKIANIKGRDIQFIDLSSSRPYATL